MIPKIILGKGARATRRLIGYLYGPGSANEHTDPHLVASWNGFAPTPAAAPPQPQERRGPTRRAARPAREHARRQGPGHHGVALSGPRRARGPDPDRRPVGGHRPPDRGCRRHRPRRRRGSLPLGRRPARRRPHPHRRHPRPPGRPPPRRDHDIRAVQREARKIETDFGLRRLKPGDGTAAKRPPARSTSRPNARARTPRPARSCADASAARWPQPPPRRSSSPCWKRPA